MDRNTSDKYDIVLNETNFFKSIHDRYINDKCMIGLIFDLFNTINVYNEDHNKTHGNNIIWLVKKKS